MAMNQQRRLRSTRIGPVCVLVILRRERELLDAIVVALEDGNRITKEEADELGRKLMVGPVCHADRMP
jgi:hypothetical protein